MKFIKYTITIRSYIQNIVQCQTDVDVLKTYVNACKTYFTIDMFGYY